MRRYADADLIEQAWQVATEEMRAGLSIGVAQYQIDVTGKLMPIRALFPTGKPSERLFFRALEAFKKTMS